MEEVIRGVAGKSYSTFDKIAKGKFSSHVRREAEVLRGISRGVSTPDGYRSLIPRKDISFREAANLREVAQVAKHDRYLQKIMPEEIKHSQDNTQNKKVATVVEKVNAERRSYGKPELRKLWQEKIKEKNPSLRGEISLPVVTNALTHGLSMIGYLFINPGDKIILTDKFWGNYKLIFEKGYHATLETYNTFKGNNLDLESFEKKLAEEKGKQIILINFPHNPTGYTPTIKEANKQIVRTSMLILTLLFQQLWQCRE